MYSEHQRRPAPRNRAASPFSCFRALALASAGVAYAAGCTETTPAELYIESPVINLGVIDPGVHDFAVAVENRGGRALAIGNIASSCTCMSVQAPPLLSPGSKSDIQVKVKVSPGVGSASLSITLSGAETRIVHLEWQGKSPPRLVSPEIEIAQRTGEGASQEVEVSYAGGDGSDLRFLGALGLPDDVTVELVADDPFAIRPTPGLGVGKNPPPPVVGKAVLRLKSSATRAHVSSTTCTLKVRLRGVEYELPLLVGVKVHDGIQARPEKLFFSGRGWDRLKNVDRRAIVSTSGVRIDQLGVSRKPSFLEVSLASVGSPPVATLTARVTAAPPTGLSQDAIILKDRRGAELLIPVLVSYEP